ncbi:MAG: tetratricopeptide repeat protein [Treponemataceae bacterium]
MKKVVNLTVLLSLVFLTGSVGSVVALDISLRFLPEVTVPISTDGESVYTIGGGGTLVADVEVLRGLAPYAEAGVKVVPVKSTGSMLSLSSGGIGAGFSLYPVPRLKLRIAGAGGFYYGSALNKTGYGPFWETRAEAGYRFSPSFSLLAGAGYSSYLNGPSSVLFNGLSFGLTVDVTLGSASNRTSGVTIIASQREAVFPIQYYAYAKNPLGGVKITNDETAEIRDVEIRFKSEGLTSAAILCGSFPLLRPGASVEAPFLAAFGEKALEFTESSKAQGEFIVTYRLLDTRIEKSFSTSVSFNHRNAVNWKDPRAVAAFASPNDTAVLDLSKFVAGLVRDRLRPDIDHALQYGMGIFEGLRLTGLAYATDPSAPYKECRNDVGRTDYVQYPYQTFAYKGGDSDDLSLLYIAALSSVGLETAFLPLPDKAYAAFALQASENEARRFFADPSLFAWKDEKAWVIVDTSRLREGFLAAWRAGADAWNASVSAKATDGFFTMTDAWKEFKPVGVGSPDTKVVKPREDRLELAFENVLGRFVSMELAPRIERIRTEMGAAGGTARQLNSLGILYARFGLYKEAKETFAKSVEKGSRTAVINLANVVFLLKDYEEAARLYSETLKEDPENKNALLGLARSRYELDAYADADELFARVNKVDPAFAAKYAYLSSRIGTGTSRAASADREGSVPWQDAE